MVTRLTWSLDAYLPQGQGFTKSKQAGLWPEVGPSCRKAAPSAVNRMIDPDAGREHMRILTWIALTGLAALAMAAQAADDYPTRPVRIVAGFGPGATIDVTAR